jgi:hypothetical protein
MASLSVVSLDPGRTSVLAVNDTSHLASLALAYAPPRPAG